MSKPRLRKDNDYYGDYSSEIVLSSEFRIFRHDAKNVRGILRNRQPIGENAMLSRTRGCTVRAFAQNARGNADETELKRNNNKVGSGR